MRSIFEYPCKHPGSYSIGSPRTSSQVQFVDRRTSQHRLGADHQYLPNSIKHTDTILQTLSFHLDMHIIIKFNSQHTASVPAAWHRASHSKEWSCPQHYWPMSDMWFDSGAPPQSGANAGSSSSHHYCSRRPRWQGGLRYMLSLSYCPNLNAKVYLTNLKIITLISLPVRGVWPESRMGRQMGRIPGEGVIAEERRSKATSFSRVAGLNLGWTATFVTVKVFDFFNWRPAVTSKDFFSFLFWQIVNS